MYNLATIHALQTDKHNLWSAKNESDKSKNNVLQYIIRNTKDFNKQEKSNLHSLPELISIAFCG